ncbi:WRKY transcription factor [Quillaja saponaria]|uniref:WRKY transcription factor n=1 Tax=Quillaja saponaria TaxID=32244 RepID=A0AAD7LW69_QUISA|nr:WRKY transcription factor [Quillaja saponaria]
MGDWEQRNLINELIQGRELARQLQICLNAPSSSHEDREFLLKKIITSFEKALAMLNCSGFSVGEPSQLIGGPIPMSESPPSLSGSPRSEDSDKEGNSRKRKGFPRWTKQIRVSPGMGLEGPLDDGYSWRKYGQKDILGAKYPRGYYRCTHRNVQGCLATKQVQRSDEDPTVFEITYRGRHTCNTQASNVIPPSSSQEFQEPGPHSNIVNPQQQNVQQQQLQEKLLNFRAGLRVLTENLDAPQQSFPSLHFPSTSNIEADQNLVFSTSMIVSPSGMNTFGGNQNLPSSESEINEIISAATSATNSPTIGLEFPFEPDAVSLPMTND